MKYYNIKVIALLIVLLAAAAGATALLVGRYVARGMLVAIIALVAAGLLLRLVRRPFDMLAAFVSAVKMNDTSARFDTDNHDDEIDRIAHGMNSITSLLSKNRQELETRKLYYDRILRVMTHEMRNSITPIQALSSAIVEQPAEYGREEIEGALALIKGQSDNISRFLDSYHALTHIPYPEKSVFDGTVFMSKLKKTISTIAAKYPGCDRCVSMTVATGVKVYADEGLITQALTNLVKNALDSVESVSRAGKDGYAPRVSVSLISREDNTMITIEDNGAGLADKIAKDPFQPFVTTKPGGSGIGMFISRQIIMMHGGKVRLFNNPGKGLAISILIPSIPTDK